MASQLPHIFVIGATGRTGKLVLNEALKRGHSVTALIRREGSLGPQQNLAIIQGDPTSAADIERALTETVKSTASLGSSIVLISTLGQTRTSGNPWAATTSPPRFMAASADAVVSVLSSGKFPRVQKYVVMSVFGAGDSFSNLNFLMRAIMKHSNMAQTVEDHNLVDGTVKKSGIKFVMARACMLKGETKLPIKECGNEGEKASFMPSVSMQSVASFLLDAASSDTWDGKTPVICN